MDGDGSIDLGVPRRRNGVGGAIGNNTVAVAIGYVLAAVSVGGDSAHVPTTGVGGGGLNKIGNLNVGRRVMKLKTL
eukprot:scaffold122099_cov35-Tisochrysis_lutea.AAC.3